MEPRLGEGGVSWPPVILQGSLAMMYSIINCKCCRCYIAVEMNHSDLLNQLNVSGLVNCEKFQCVVESLFW